MQWTADKILKILDACCDDYSFPMLDDGYAYPAATRLALYRAPEDWAVVIEVFGYSPRAGIPDTQVQTFASKPRRSRTVDNFVSNEAFEKYLANNPYNESSFVCPIDEGDWMDPDDQERIARGQPVIVVRGQATQAPLLSEYADAGVVLEDPEQAAVFEYCRYLAHKDRMDVLATEDEQRINLGPEFQKILQLEEWNHPNIVNKARPSESATFKALAEVLVSGDASAYRAPEPPNSHWSNWPEGGLL